MATAVEKTAEELRRELEELRRQQREITERLRDPRGIRRGGLAANGVRVFRPRGFIRPVSESEDQPAPKRRLFSAVVKVQDGEPADERITSDQNPLTETVVASGNESERKPLGFERGGFKRDANQRAFRKADAELPSIEHVPRILPKDEDPRLVNRNKRMLGQLLGTLERFREEHDSFSASEAHMRRSDSLKRAEQRAREESERLRQQEREQIAEKRKRDLTLRARIAAKAEEKKLELIFLRWSEHHKKLSNFLRTKTEPPIYYLPVRPLQEDVALAEQYKEQVFHEWRTARRQELTEYQKQIGAQFVANVEAELERWQNARSVRRSNMINLQETMDKELDTHRLEHGPKTWKIPGRNEEDEEVEDIAVEDDMMDDVLEVDDGSQRGDVAKPETQHLSPVPEEPAQ